MSDAAEQHAPDLHGPPCLSVSGLTKAYAGRPVVSDLSFDVARGSICALVGPNGVGKTTTLRCILGADEADAGTVSFHGRPLDERDPATRARIAAVLDDMGWFPDLTSSEHLDLLARAHGDDDPYDRVDAALTALGLASVADQVPISLSSGQRRRLALATTMVRHFDLLVLDEPEQRLDTQGRAWLSTYLQAARTNGAAVLIASHDPELLAATGAQVVHLRAEP